MNIIKRTRKQKVVSIITLVVLISLATFGVINGYPKCIPFWIGMGLGTITGWTWRSSRKD